MEKAKYNFYCEQCWLLKIGIWKEEEQPATLCYTLLYNLTATLICQFT